MATTKLLSQRGYQVFAFDLNGEKLTQEFDGMMNVTHAQMDVTKDDSVNDAIELIKKTEQPLYAVINAAGIASSGPLLSESNEKLDKVMAVNVGGPLRFTRACYPLMEGTGRIVMLSSMAGVLAAVFHGCYSISKYALEAMGDLLRRELSQTDIYTVLIEPGPVNTPMLTNLLEMCDKDIDKYKDDPVYGKGIVSLRTAYRRMEPVAVSPEDVARTVAIAISPQHKPDPRYLVAHPVISLLTRLLTTLPHTLADKVMQLL